MCDSEGIDTSSFLIESKISGDCVNACSSIYEECGDNCLVINLAEREYDKIFYPNCYKNNTENGNIMSTDKFPVISLTLDEHGLKVLSQLNEYNGDISPMNGHYILSYYFDSLETEESEIMRELLKNNFYYGSITGIMAIAYNTIYLWKSSVQVAHSFDLEILRKSIVLSYYNGPGGRYTINKEGIINAQIHVGKIENGKIVIYNKQTSIVNGYQYLSMSKTCDWVTATYKQSTQLYLTIIMTNKGIIGQLMALYGETFQLVIDYINDQRVGDELLKPIYPDITGSDKLDVLSAVDDSTIVYIGTITNNNRTSIHNYLKSKNKFLMSILPGEGEQCLSNVITVLFILFI